MLIEVSTTKMRHFLKRAMTLSLVVAVLPSVALSLDGLPTGESWLKWDDEIRATYVEAYIGGSGRGFRDGCVAGERLYAGAPPKNLPGEKCVTLCPRYSKNVEYYAATITQYYRSYPSDRAVPIFKVLESLNDSKSWSIEEMHQIFPAILRTPH